MRRRRPRFALMLSTLVAAAVLAIVLTGRGSTPQPTTGQPPTVGIGPTRACVTTSAEAAFEDRSGIVITATVEAPVSATEQASGPSGIATVTRSEVVTARVRADQPVEVTRTSAARARACANGQSTTAARTTALRSAYAQALAAAHALASRQAAQSLMELIHREYPTVATDAKRRAAARARQLALAAEQSLAAQALAEARQRAAA